MHRRSALASWGWIATLQQTWSNLNPGIFGPLQRPLGLHLGCNNNYNRYRFALHRGSQLSLILAVSGLALQGSSPTGTSPPANDFSSFPNPYQKCKDIVMVSHFSSLRFWSPKSPFYFWLLPHANCTRQFLPHVSLMFPIFQPCQHCTLQAYYIYK